LILWYCQLAEVVCQNCWLSAERNQLSDGGSLLENSFVWLPPTLRAAYCWLSSTTGFLESPAPYGDMPELVAPREVTSLIVNLGFSQVVRPCPRLSSQLPWVGWYCQLPDVVCQNCCLPSEKDHLSDGDSVSENSFIWLPPFLFYSPCSIFVPREPRNKSHHPRVDAKGCIL
jgi:hypothetical protein